MPIADPALNERLGKLELCASYAPAHTYDGAKRAATMLSELRKHIADTFRRNGYRALEDDDARNMQVALLHYLLVSNPEAVWLELGELWGDRYARGIVPAATAGTTGAPPTPPRLCRNCGLPRGRNEVLCDDCRER